MSEWKEYTIDELKSSSKAAISIGPFGSRMKSDCYVDKGIPVIRGNNISDAPSFIGEFVFISEEKAKQLKSSKVYKDDLVFPHRGNIGEAGIVVGDKYKEYVISSSLMKLSCNTDLACPKLLYYFFKSNQGRKKLLENASQVGTPGIATPLTSLKNIKISLPSISEQNRIADILSCLDAKIDNLRQQNETLEEIARSIFKHWFIDFEFPNPDGKPYKSSGGAMVRSDLGDIPEGWRVGKLGDVVSVNSQSIDKNYLHHIIEYVDISSVGIGTLENTTQYKLAEAPSRARRLVEHGDVIWSGVRPNRKSYLFICKPIDNLIISTGFVVLSPKKIPSSYLYSWVTTSMFVDYLTLNASGSAYPAVKAEHFEIADIILPSISILDKFHLLIDPMRIKTHDNSLQIQTLTKTRDALLPKLMSGQLRVNE